MPAIPAFQIGITSIGYSAIGEPVGSTDRECTLAVADEDRTLAVPMEIRTLAILGENRTLAILGENRTLAIAGEDRTLVIPAMGSVRYSMAKIMPPKDPSGVKDYVFDWAAWLGSDTISTATVTVETGITLASTVTTATNVTAWLSGGTAGQTYAINCQVTTAGGRTEQQTMYVPVRQL